MPIYGSTRTLRSLLRLAAAVAVTDITGDQIRQQKERYDSQFRVRVHPTSQREGSRYRERDPLQNAIASTVAIPKQRNCRTRCMVGVDWSPSIDEAAAAGCDEQECPMCDSPIVGLS